MDKAQEKLVLDIMRRHNAMTLATVRPDGFPQATTVTYANEGFDLYFCCDTASQKAKNMRKSDKVSATIDRYTRDWNKIKALSLGGHAQVLKQTRARTCLRAAGKEIPGNVRYPAERAGPGLCAGASQRDVSDRLHPGLRSHRTGQDQGVLSKRSMPRSRLLIPCDTRCNKCDLGAGGS